MNTNEEFKKLMSEHNIGVTKASRMMDASGNTVKCWASPEGSQNYRKMPPYALKLFKLMVACESSVSGSQ